MSYSLKASPPRPAVELVAVYHCRQCGCEHRDFEPLYAPHFAEREALEVRPLTCGDRFAREWERLTRLFGGRPIPPRG